MGPKPPLLLLLLLLFLLHRCLRPWVSTGFSSLNGHHRLQHHQLSRAKMETLSQDRTGKPHHLSPLSLGVAFRLQLRAQWLPKEGRRFARFGASNVI